MFVLASFLVLLFSSDGTAESETGAFLQVKNALVHAPTKSDLNLTCYVNGTGLSASDVSWMFKGNWLDNKTMINRPDSKTVQLLLRNISLQNNGIYKCSVRDPSKHNILHQNVTVVVGDLPPRVEKGDINCIMNGPKSTNVKWSLTSASNGQESSIWFDLLYCRPSSVLRYCSHPPVGYIESECTGLQANTSEKPLQCNMNKAVRHEFPELFNISISSPGASPNLCFSVRTKNAFGEQYSQRRCYTVGKYSWCGPPSNVSLSTTAGSIKITWNAPPSRTSKGHLSRFMWYNVTYAAEDANVNESQEMMEHNSPYNINQIVNGLKADTLYIVYLSCAKDRHSLVSPDSIVGPFSVKTLEDVPSSSPTVRKFVLNSQNGTNRNISIFWENPPESYWKGEIQKYIIFYRKSSENVTFSVIAWNNVSSDSTPLTEGKLHNLERFLDYTVEVAMCTSAGCGEKGGSFKITRDIKVHRPPTAKPTGSSDGHLLVIGISVSSFALLITLVMAAIFIWRTKNRAPSQGRRLSEIGNPMPYDYEPAADAGVAENDEVYDVVGVVQAPESPVGELSTDPLIHQSKNGNKERSILEMSTEL